MPQRPSAGMSGLIPVVELTFQRVKLRGEGIVKTVSDDVLCCEEFWEDGQKEIPADAGKW